MLAGYDADRVRLALEPIYQEVEPKLWAYASPADAINLSGALRAFSASRKAMSSSTRFLAASSTQLLRPRTLSFQVRADSCFATFHRAARLAPVVRLRQHLFLDGSFLAHIATCTLANFAFNSTLSTCYLAASSARYSLFSFQTVANASQM